MTKTILASGGAGVGVGLLLRAVTRGDAPATTLIAGALILCVVAPWWTATRSEDDRPQALTGFGASAALILGLCLAAPAAFGPGLLGGMGYLLLWATTLIGVTCSAGRAGQPVATALGVLVLAFPYYAELPRGLFGMADAQTLSLVLHAPLPVLAGTFGDVDLLRQGALYQRFPLGQAWPYSYPGPAHAFYVLIQLAAAAWVLPALPRLRDWLRRRREEGAGAPPVAVAAMALVLLGAPDTAQAQLFPQPTPGGGGSGELVTRVRLGYWIAKLEGELQVKGQQEPPQGSIFSYSRHLDLDQEFLLPSFEIELSWENAGRVFAQYIENRWKGETQTTQDFIFEEQRIKAGNIQETKYLYRTIALGGAFDLPIADWLNGYVVTTQRYIKHEVKIRSLPQGLAARNSLEAFVPTIGLGAEILIWNVISAYGDIQWLDFRTSIGGADDGRYAFKYREFRFGVRFSLVEHAHVLVEYYHLRTEIKQGKNGEKYDTKLLGIRVQVSVLF